MVTFFLLAFSVISKLIWAPIGCLSILHDTYIRANSRPFSGAVPDDKCSLLSLRDDGMLFLHTSWLLQKICNQSDLPVIQMLHWNCLACPLCIFLYQQHCSQEQMLVISKICTMWSSALAFFASGVMVIKTPSLTVQDLRPVRLTVEGRSWICLRSFPAGSCPHGN